MSPLCLHPLLSSAWEQGGAHHYASGALWPATASQGSLRKNPKAQTCGAAARGHGTAPELAAAPKTQTACHALPWRRNGHGQEQKTARWGVGAQICSEDLEAETATRDSHKILCLSHGQNRGAEIRACCPNWRIYVGPIHHNPSKQLAA